MKVYKTTNWPRFTRLTILAGLLLIMGVVTAPATADDNLPQIVDGLSQRVTVVENKVNEHDQEIANLQAQQPEVVVQTSAQTAPVSTATPTPEASPQPSVQPEMIDPPQNPCDFKNAQEWADAWAVYMQLPAEVRTQQEDRHTDHYCTAWTK